MPNIDPNKTWKLLEQRRDQETDPVVRHSLELVAKHMRCEAKGDIEGVLTTLCDKPIYRLHFGDEMREVGGSIERIRQLYHDAVIAPGAHRLEHDVTRVLADRNAVYTEGDYRQVYPGKSLIGMGIEVDDPEAWYTAECRMAMVWPRDPETGLLTGEEVWVDGNRFDGIAKRKIGLDEVLPIIG